MHLNNLPILFPQIILTLGIVFVLLLGIRRSSDSLMRQMTVLTGLIFLAITSWIGLSFPGYSDMNGIFQFDQFSQFFMLFAVLATAMTLILSGQSTEVSSRRFPEFTALLITICIGVSLISAAKDLLTAYLAMEMISLSSYVLTGFRRNNPMSHEAALKYVIYGGVASGVMIFGMSMMYGMTGSLSFASISRLLISGNFLEQLGKPGMFGILVSCLFIFTGFCFKIAAVPFHMWCPDVYQGAPTPFTGFLSVAPKAAGFALIVRFMSTIFGSAYGSIRWPILAILGIISAVTMTLGNFTALHQSNVKRLLAYSSIAHAGYLLMGVVVLNSGGNTAVLLYLVIYLFMNLGAFAVVQTIADLTGSEDISAYRGLGFRSPFLAFALSVFLFSLAGIPPLAGFIGKFYLFAAVLKTAGNWYLALAIVGILNSLVALFYYARLLREMYFSQPEATAVIHVPAVNKGMIGFMVVPTFLIGIYWEPVRAFVSAAIGALRLM
jgi:NADH-quinone oxidoreductase subunit N